MEPIQVAVPVFGGPDGHITLPLFPSCPSPLCSAPPFSFGSKAPWKIPGGKAKGAMKGGVEDVDPT